MEPRVDHGLFAVLVDGVVLDSRNYTAVPDCQVSYSSPLLHHGKHTVLVTLLDSNPASSSSTSTLQLHSLM